jgi:hypothetical protein
MKFWGYLAAKLLVGAIGCALIGIAFQPLLPKSGMSLRGASTEPFVHDLTYTLVMLGYFLFCLGVAYIIIQDQRLRCRTCVRKLRMPIAKGSWTHILLSPPRTEYICPYGHGTLKVPELQLGGPHPNDWEPHEDMWKELFSVEEKK